MRHLIPAAVRRRGRSAQAGGVGTEAGERRVASLRRLFAHHRRAGRAGARRGRRVFLLSGRRLEVWCWRSGRCEAQHRFEADEAGRGRFSAYLAEEPPVPVRVLVDLVEEEFREDSVPRVFGPDRRALIEARRRRLFGDPTWGASLGQGRSGAGGREEGMLFTALTRPERLTPWLDAIARHRVPLAGVHSLPLLTERLLHWMPAADASHLLVVTWQRAGGLRQTFFVEGRIKLSRLAVPPRLAEGERAAWLLGEVEHLRRYLARGGLLSAADALDACVVAEPGLESALLRLSPAGTGTRCRVVPLPALARRLGVEDSGELLWPEPLFVALLARYSPGHQYAPASAIADYALHRLRGGVRAASLLVAGIGVLGAGAGLAGGIEAALFAESLAAQTALYRQRYDEARERLPQTPLALPALQLAVDSAEELHAARTSPEAALAALSLCLDRHAGIRIEGIDWNAEAHTGAMRTSGSSPPLSAGSGAPPGGVPAEGGLQSVEIRGRVAPFDGNFRRALEQVGGFADSLRDLPDVLEVEMLSLPLDVGSGASLRGDAGARAAAAEAPFALRFRWRSRRAA